MAKDQGFTLIEVIISLMLFALLLYGFYGTELLALKKTLAAYDFSVAEEQLQSIQEYVSSFEANDVYTYMAKWNKENHELLPQGQGRIWGQSPHFMVQLVWNKTTFQTCDKPKLSGCLLFAIG